MATHRTSDAGELTSVLVTHIRRIECDTLPSDVREIALQCVLDWLAVTVAASRDPLASLLLDQAREEGGNPVSTIVARALKVAPLQAALVNGATSHILDYDDVNLSMNGHPSAVILPALLALAESRRASGRDVIAAFVAGYETACRVGLLVAPGHYHVRGHHATATIGAIASAAACSHLIRLESQPLAYAIGIAATQAAGLKSMFGTQCKPFHAGLAAQSGLRAAQLAARGMGSRPDVLECRQGFASTLSPDFNPDAILRTAEKYYLRENLFKYHASCYGTHSAIEAARHLRSAHALTPQMIERVIVRVEQGADLVCNIPNPRTGLEAKFSLRLTTALALAGMDTSDLMIFNERTAADPQLCALRDRISVEMVRGWPSVQAEVIVELKDGRRVSETQDAGIPLSDVAEQARRVDAKFDRLVTPVLGSERCSALKAKVRALAETNIDIVMAASA